MKNRSIEKVKSKVRIAVKGKNINRFLLRLHKNKISILEIKKINNNEAYILIYFKDYELVLKLNTIYEIFIVSYGGWEKEKRTINRNIILLFGIILSLIIVSILSKMIFKVDVITTDTKMRDKILYELKQYDIEKFKFQKSYNTIQNIKSDLLERYREEIEWLEIELVGTRYIIRYEPRIINDDSLDYSPRNIIASKNAVILSVVSSKGQIIKFQNEYVHKGDVIVSGEIKLNDEVKEVVSASGTVYGETWYEVETFYPFSYYEQTKTGRVKNIYAVKFLNWRVELFNFNKFYDKMEKEDIILENRVIPLKFLKIYQMEVDTKSSVQTVEETSDKALSLAITKVENKLSDNEYIIKYKVINKTIEAKGVRLKVFFSVCEDITEYVEIKEEENA